MTYLKPRLSYYYSRFVKNIGILLLVSILTSTVTTVSFCIALPNIDQHMTSYAFFKMAVSSHVGFCVRVIFDDPQNAIVWPSLVFKFGFDRVYNVGDSANLPLKYFGDFPANCLFTWLFPLCMCTINGKFTSGMETVQISGFMGIELPTENPTFNVVSFSNKGEGLLVNREHLLVKSFLSSNFSVERNHIKCPINNWPKIPFSQEIRVKM